MSSGGFQLVGIYQWDEANDEAITLADAACAAYIDNEGERFELADFPTTARVLATGEIAVIDADMVDAETAWMIEYGLNSLLLAPLFEQDKIIGLAEIASADRTLLSNRDTIRACQNVIEQASAWLTAPLRNNPKDDLLDLARNLKTATNASSCSLSSWLPNSNAATVVVTYSSAFWNLGIGPKTALKEWMSAKLVLE
jgi:hypothetical protein